MLILLLAAFWAGTQNALAGGGSFVTLPALMLAGMDARAANITSTIALFRKRCGDRPLALPLGMRAAQRFSVR
jgi:uncharacterized membrane protein YfcA